MYLGGIRSCQELPAALLRVCRKLRVLSDDIRIGSVVYIKAVIREITLCADIQA